jgi:hypothetical protein
MVRIQRRLFHDVRLVVVVLTVVATTTTTTTRVAAVATAALMDRIFLLHAVVLEGLGRFERSLFGQFGCGKSVDGL